MATTSLLTLDEYHARYGSENGYEYWFGKVVRKSVPTWLHSILQGLLVELLNYAGYTAGSELELRIDRHWEPKPDVAATLHVEQPYPTKPIEIVAEILSPDDAMDKVREKCEHYSRVGIAQIFVLVPEGRSCWEWNHLGSILEPVTSQMRLAHGATISLSSTWTEMER